MKRRKSLPAEGGGAITICITAMTCELLATFLPLEISFGAIEIEDQCFQILKEIQRIEVE